MTAADDLTAVWASVRPVFAENFHADTYAVVRTTSTPDGSGGTTETGAVVETGRCALDVANRLGGERMSGGTVMAVSIYVAELPVDSIVAETDTLRVNGRTFAITDVKRGGNHDLFTEVTLEERA